MQVLSRNGQRRFLDNLQRAVDMTLNKILMTSEDPIKIEEFKDLSSFSWFRVGGKARWFAQVQDERALHRLWEVKPESVPVTHLGAGSNVIVRDGGIDGLVVRLGRGFREIEQLSSSQIRVGAGNLCAQVAGKAQRMGLSGVEYLATIPGTIGGATVMNAGAYGGSFHERVVSVEGINAHGVIVTLTPQDIQAGYRCTNIPTDVLVTHVVLDLEPGNPEVITRQIDHFIEQRKKTQPIRAKTGGSTFKNPVPLNGGEIKKAWQLVDEAGCRGLYHKGIRVSEKHCNFLINEDATSANAIEELGDMVRDRVYQQSGVRLEWEIKRLGSKQEGKL